MLGIAVGVALLFASQVASTSLDGSVAAARPAAWSATCSCSCGAQPAGLRRTPARRGQRLPGVQRRVPVLEQHADVIGPRGQRVGGPDRHRPAASRTLGGPLLRHFSARQLERPAGARAARPGRAGDRRRHPQPVEAAGRRAREHRSARRRRSHEGDIGALVHSPVAIAPLAYAQQLTGMQGRITRIFVRARARARTRRVRAGLVHARGGRLNVEPGRLRRDAVQPGRRRRPTSPPTCSRRSARWSASCSPSTRCCSRCRCAAAWSATCALDGRLARMTSRRCCSTRWSSASLASRARAGARRLLSLALFHANPATCRSPSRSARSGSSPGRASRSPSAAGMLAALRRRARAAASDILSRRSLRRARGGESVAGAWAARGVLGAALLCLALTTAILLARPAARSSGSSALVVALLLLLPLLLRRLRRWPSSGCSARCMAAPRRSGGRSSCARPPTRALAGDRGDRRDRGVRQRRDPGRPPNLQRGLDSRLAAMNRDADVWVAPSGTRTCWPPRRSRTHARRARAAAGRASRRRLPRRASSTSATAASG